MMADIREGTDAGGFEIYVVKPADTVDSIADAVSVNADRIIEDNQLIYPYELAVGQALFIPASNESKSCGNDLDDCREGRIPRPLGSFKFDDPQAAGYLTHSGTGNPSKNIRSIGYAYPFISRWVLEQTMPYLSELAVFSYGFTPDGYLLAPQLPVDWMIAVADEYGTQSILTLTPFGTDGRFNNQLIHALVGDGQAMDRLIDEMLYTMENKGYSGVDIDFEYILSEDRDRFTQFVRRVSDRMRENGYHTSVALAPKTSAGQQGLLYEGKDYQALGEAADHVLLMTYEWGYTYGPPMAVAPINQVRRVVEYAITEIPAQKIDLGIPNYGYDWPLPYERGVTAATTIGNIQAVRIAIEKGVPIEFDNLSASPFFRYQTDGIEHEVWFEDVRSLQQKFDLIKEFGLGGCGYWQIMRWFKANWLLLEKNFYVDRDFENSPL